MRTENKVVGRTSSPVYMILVMQLISIVAMLTFAAIIAYLISADMLSESTSGVCASVILAVSTFLGGISIKSETVLQQSVLCTIGSVVFFGILLCSTSLVLSTGFSRVGINALMVLIGCASAIVMACAKIGQRRKARYKYRSR